MNKTIISAVCVLVLAVGAVVLFFLKDSRSSTDVRAKTETLDQVESADPEPSPEADALAHMEAMKNPDERIAHLDWIAKQPWARSDLPVLRTTIIGDSDESVQLHAVETALKLASREGAGATSDVVRTSLASTRDNTRARGLKAAREHPDLTLVSELIELVDNNDPYVAMALNALAHTGSAEAHAKILQVAGDENASPAARERALYLLVVTRDPEAWSLLNGLVDGEDEHLRDVATTVLRLLNEK